jgi:hypothetical protein
MGTPGFSVCPARPIASMAEQYTSGGQAHIVKITVGITHMSGDITRNGVGSEPIHESAAKQAYRTLSNPSQSQCPCGSMGSDQKSRSRMFFLRRVCGALSVYRLPRSHSLHESPLTAATCMLQSRPETRTRKFLRRQRDGISRVVPRFARCLYGHALDQSAWHRRCLHAHPPPIYGLAR